MINTLFIILEQSLLHIPLIVGAYISLSLLKVPDLSLESAYMFGAFCGAQTVLLTVSIPWLLTIKGAILSSLLGGALVGLTSSMITYSIGIPHLLSSIVTFGIFHGINQLLFGVHQSLSTVQNPFILPYGFSQHPEMVILGIISLVVIVLGFLFLRTSLGNCFAVFGQNPLFFNHYGISSSYVFVMGVVIANALAGLSGYLMAQTSGFAEMNMGIGKILFCITALILARVLLQLRAPSIWYPLVGVFGYFVIQQLLLKVGFNLKYFTMVQAIIVLIILAILYRRHQLNPTDQVGV